MSFFIDVISHPFTAKVVFFQVSIENRIASPIMMAEIIRVIHSPFTMVDLYGFASIASSIFRQSSLVVSPM